MTGDVMAEYPKRKLLRLQDYNYSQNGTYFVTVCTQNREPIFGNVGGRFHIRPYDSSRF